MLLLFETAAGHALYELKHEDKLKKLMRTNWRRS
jgi:hypothetical protein